MAIFFPFFYPDWNVLFQQPSTSCLACPVRTWHDGKKGETSLAADRAEIHCLKVKHGNDTKRPHIPGTSTKYKRKPRTLPSLVPYGQKLAMLDLDCERHQNRNVHNCWFHLPPPAKPQSRKGMEFAKCRLETISLHLQVFLAVLRLIFAIHIYGSTKNIIIIFKLHWNEKEAKNNLPISSELSRFFSPYSWQMGLDCPQPFGAISWLQIQLQVHVHPACLWATGIGCRNFKKLWKMSYKVLVVLLNYLNWVRPGGKNNEIFRQVYPQSHVGCQRVPCTNRPSVDTWCTIEILMSSHVGDVLQHVHRQVSNAGLIGPTL